MPQAVVVERVQRLGSKSCGAELIGVLSRRDHAAYLGRDLEELDKGQTATEAGEAALGAARCLDVPCFPEQTLLRRADHRVQLVHRRFVTAVRADPSHQALCRHSNQTSCDSERLDADVFQSGDCADGVVRVQS